MLTECSPALFDFAPVDGRRVVAGGFGGRALSSTGQHAKRIRGPVNRLSSSRITAGSTITRSSEIARPQLWSRAPDTLTVAGAEARLAEGKPIDRVARGASFSSVASTP